MQKIDSVIAEVSTAIEKLSAVKNQLKELKENAEAVERARDSLRNKKTKTDDIR